MAADSTPDAGTPQPKRQGLLARFRSKKPQAPHSTTAAADANMDATDLAILGDLGPETGTGIRPIQVPRSSKPPEPRAAQRPQTTSARSNAEPRRASRVPASASDSGQDGSVRGTVPCAFCGRTQEVCRSRRRNLLEWSICLLVVPYRCLYCGYRGRAFRFQVPKTPANQEILNEGKSDSRSGTRPGARPATKTKTAGKH